jgi:hypothetical protein
MMGVSTYLLIPSSYKICTLNDPSWQLKSTENFQTSWTSLQYSYIKVDLKEGLIYFDTKFNILGKTEKKIKPNILIFACKFSFDNTSCFNS